jgi:hypothetical protein
MKENHSFLPNGGMWTSPIGLSLAKTSMLAAGLFLWAVVPSNAGESTDPSGGGLPEVRQESEASDLAYCGIQKRRVFSQSGAADPVPDPDSPFVFSSHIRATQAGVLLPTTSLNPPAGGTGETPHEHGSFGLMLHAIFRNQTTMDAAYPAGDYLIRIETTDGGTHPITLTLGANDYPGVPKITSATNAQWQDGVLKVTDPSEPVTLQWSNPGNHATWFQIDGTGIRSENSQPASGFTVPAGELENNALYRASVRFMNITASGHDGIVNAGFETDLYFLIEVGSPAREDGDFYLLMKSHSLSQISNDGPAHLPNLRFDSDRAPYSMTVESPVPGTLSGPDETVFALAFHAGHDGPSYQYLSDPADTAAALNAAHPNGTYEFPGVVEVEIAGDLYPDVANILLVNGAPPVWNAQGQLALNPDVENTIVWSNVVVPEFETWGYQMVEFWNDNDDNFNGIEEERGAPFGQPDPLTSLTIPAGSMTRTFTYNGTIEYARITTFEEIDPEGEGDGMAAAGYFAENRFMAVALNPQSINFPSISSMTYPSAPFDLVADASSELPVAFEVVSGPAVIENGTLALTGEGTVTVRASQKGNATFASAAPVTQSFAVEAAEGSLLDDFRATHDMAADGSDDLATPAGDGVPNLLKFAFNMIGEDEGQASSLSVPNRSILKAGGRAGLPRMDMDAGHLAMTYVRFKSATGRGIQYVVEFSDSLSTASWATNASAVETVVDIDANLERVTVTDHAVFAKRFARVRVSAD